MSEVEMSLIMSKKEMKYNGLGLAWGPPGGGKTSFCKALSQKLAIRLSKLFTKSLLIEVNCHAVMSKWFGESVLRLQKIFDHVIAMAEEDGGNNLVCVLFDEVETLARSRGLTGDVADAMRVSFRHREPAGRRLTPIRLPTTS